MSSNQDKAIYNRPNDIRICLFKIKHSLYPVFLYVAHITEHFEFLYL